jgi:hypothetical protein
LWVRWWTFGFLLQWVSYIQVSYVYLLYFFICNLFNVAFSWLGLYYNVEWKDEIWMMNFKGCGKKGSRPNVKVLSRNLIGRTEEIHVKPQ